MGSMDVKKVVEKAVEREDKWDLKKAAALVA